MFSFVTSILLAIALFDYCQTQQIDLVTRENVRVNGMQPIISQNKAISFTTKHNENKKYCRYRDKGLYPEYLWLLLTAGECYYYASNQRFKRRLPYGYVPIRIDNVTYPIPATQVNKTIIPFNYTNEIIFKIIADSFISEHYIKQWLDCASSAIDCCQNHMNHENIEPSDNYPCPATWDAWSCFPQTAKGSVAEMPCPQFILSSNDTPCMLSSQKKCYENETWQLDTDYVTCATAPVYRRRHNFHVIVSYISIALCFPAVLIFFCYQNLRVLRVILHRNLIIACILRNILTIMNKEIIVLDSLKPSTESNNVLLESGAFCKSISLLLNVATNFVYACMLVDAIYLHKLVVRIFSDDPNIYILCGAVAAISVLPSAIWAVVVGMTSDEYCWIVDNSWYQWIPDGFRIGVLAINIILLIDIMRVLICKLRNNINAQHTKYSYTLINGMPYSAFMKRAYISTLRAMLFLIPLFGVPFLLTANRNIIDTSSCIAGDIYYYVSYLIQALQGIMVSILFCYWNKEVHAQLKGTFRKLNSRFRQRFQMSDRRQTNNPRRTTAGTYVRSSMAPFERKNLSMNLDISREQNKVQNWLVTAASSVHSNIQLPVQDEYLTDPTSPLKKLSFNKPVSNTNVENQPHSQTHEEITEYIDDSMDDLRIERDFKEAT